MSEGVQEVMIECLRPAGALERLDRGRAPDFRGFLFGVTRRTAIAIERRWRRDQKVAFRSDSSEACDRRNTTLSAAFDRTWAQMICLQALALLRKRIASHPDHERKEKCLEGRFVHNQPPRVIAEETGIPVTVVYEILKVAKEEFRIALFEVVSQYHPGATRHELEDKCRELASHLM